MFNASILLVFTSASVGTDGSAIGWYLPEAAHPYYTLSPSHTITFVSPLGPNPPVDPDSVKNYTDERSVRFLQDPVVQEKLKTTKKLTDVRSEDYDVIFYVGGHGPVIDLVDNEASIKLAGDFYQSGRITAAVCHAPIVFSNVLDASGNSIIDGKDFTVFTNEEETELDGWGKIPYSVEDMLISKGGISKPTAVPYDPQVVVDGNLYTGQNPNSAGPLAEVILDVLDKMD